VKSKTADVVLKLIIWERIIRGTLLVILSMGLMSLINKDLGILGNQVAEALNLDVDKHYINLALRKIAMINGRMILGISLGALLYGLLDLIQAYGLHRRKRWAEYLTVIAIGFFIPLELYEVLQKQTLVRFGALGLNIAIVIFLIRHKELFPGKKKTRK
jgi:uncharacterized membrane protein (DUF2068 family)